MVPERECWSKELLTNIREEQKKLGLWPTVYGSLARWAREQNAKTWYELAAEANIVRGNFGHAGVMAYRAGNTDLAMKMFENAGLIDDAVEVGLNEQEYRKVIDLLSRNKRYSEAGDLADRCGFSDEALSNCKLDGLYPKEGDGDILVTKVPLGVKDRVLMNRMHISFRSLVKAAKVAERLGKIDEALWIYDFGSLFLKQAYTKDNPSPDVNSVVIAKAMDTRAKELRAMHEESDTVVLLEDKLNNLLSLLNGIDDSA